jgi:signal transduction protein with GAF and PtsI domain
VLYIQSMRMAGTMEPEKNINEEKLSEQLQRLLMSIEASGRAILPRSNDILLKSIVEAAAKIFGAAAASLLLVNEEEEALEFKVAFGPANHDLVGTRFPYDKGIAGYVFMTGMPIATSNVREDKRFNQDFAKSTGYVPNSILASPLISADDRVIGVMEVLDKIDGTTFNMHDMELMGLFAQQAAMAIDQSQQIDEIQQSMVRALKGLAKGDRSNPSVELQTALDQSLEKKGEMNDLLELADLFNQISALGEAERKACIQILNVFAEYRKTDSSPFRFR